MGDINISFGLFDVTAKSDTTPSATLAQDFIDINDLVLETVYPDPYVTPEEHFWKLDGTFRVFPDNPEQSTWGYWSSKYSSESGDFVGGYPEITLTMNDYHSSEGISFEFCPYGNYYCNKLHLSWYDDSTLLYSDYFYPDNWKYTCNYQVNNYNKLVITFISMNKPYSLLKIQNIAHGVLQTFNSDDITSASLYETIDLTSATLEINTLEFGLISADDDFNIFSPKGIFALLQKKQRISIDYTEPGNRIDFGTFFLNEWSSESENAMSLKCEDCLGIMDGTYFMGGIYNNVLCADLIEEILTDAGFGYILDASFDSVYISGYLPRITHREALQQVAIAIGAYVDTSRSGTVKIYPTDVGGFGLAEIGRDRKFVGTTATQRSYVSGVSVQSHEYKLSSENSTLLEIENATLGEQTILFDTPSYVTSVTGGTLIEQGANYAIIDVTSTNVSVSGKTYYDTTQIFTIKDIHLQAGEKENILEITEATLISPSVAITVAQRIYDYYQRRVEQTINMELVNEFVGCKAKVETLENQYNLGIIESLETDIFGGLITKAVILSE